MAEITAVFGEETLLRFRLQTVRFELYLDTLPRCMPCEMWASSPQSRTEKSAGYPLAARHDDVIWGFPLGLKVDADGCLPFARIVEWGWCGRWIGLMRQPPEMRRPLVVALACHRAHHRVEASPAAERGFAASRRRRRSGSGHGQIWDLGKGGRVGELVGMGLPDLRVGMGSGRCLRTWKELPSGRCSCQSEKDAARSVTPRRLCHGCRSLPVRG
ncbi:hypothetical protein ACLOJK_019306 [Asimina triloba]